MSIPPPSVNVPPRLFSIGEPPADVHPRLVSIGEPLVRVPSPPVPAILWLTNRLPRSMPRDLRLNPPELSSGRVSSPSAPAPLYPARRRERLIARAPRPVDPQELWESGCASLR